MRGESLRNARLTVYLSCSTRRNTKRLRKCPLRRPSRASATAICKEVEASSYSIAPLETPQLSPARPLIKSSSILLGSS